MRANKFHPILSAILYNPKFCSEELLEIQRVLIVSISILKD